MTHLEPGVTGVWSLNLRRTRQKNGPTRDNSRPWSRERTPHRRETPISTPFYEISSIISYIKSAWGSWMGFSSSSLSISSFWTLFLIFQLKGSHLVHVPKEIPTPHLIGLSVRSEPCRALVLSAQRWRRCVVVKKAWSCHLRSIITSFNVRISLQSAVSNYLNIYFAKLWMKN